MAKQIIAWPKWSQIINPKFIPLIQNKDRYLVLYGGRGSSKSDFTAKKLIFRCLSEKYFHCILVRNSYNSIKDSSYEQLKATIIELGLDQFFDFKVQPLEIICIRNGNRFIARGCDDTLKLKSLKDFSAVWYEEDIPTEDDFIRITTSIRTARADYLQEIFTINPEVEGNYQDHWFYKRFFRDNMNEQSFSVERKVQLSQHKEYNLTYTCHHSTYRDNRWINDGFIAWIRDLKLDNPYYFTIYAEGQWGNKQLGGLAYRNFNRGRHCNSVRYDNTLPLHISFDFNTKPFVSMTIWQIKDKDIKCIDLVAASYPKNDTKSACNIFVEKYMSHRGGLFIYGDPSGRNADTRSEEGHNDYKVIMRELEMYHPSLRVASSHPSIKDRLNFINAIFGSRFNDLNISINDNCAHLINDLLFQKEKADGTKLKEKVTKNGETWEKFGHMSDSMDYFITEALKNDYRQYIEGPFIFEREVGENEINSKWSY